MNPIQYVFIALAMVMLPHLSVQQCSWYYTVKPGDTCWGIMNYYGIASSTFYGLNPSLDCNTLQVGQTICLQGTVATTAPPTTTTAVQYYCSNVYTVQSGDYCWLIMNKYGLDSATFAAMNPSLNCNNLQVGQIICVGQSVYYPTTVAAPTTTVAPTTTTAAPTTTTTTPAPTTTTTTTTTPAPTTTTTTLAPTTTAVVYPPLCKRAYIVQAGDDCNLIAKYNGLTPTQFYSLNPGIECYNLQIGTVVCLESYEVVTTTTAAPTFAPTTVAPTTVAPTFAPTTAAPTSWNCAKPYTIQSGDYCWGIMNTYGVDANTFYNLNPGIDCYNLKVGQVVCLATWSSGCSNTYTVQSGDYCWLIMNKYGLTEQQFYSLNPGINCGALYPGQQIVIRSSCW